MAFWNWIKEHGPVLVVLLAVGGFLDRQIDNRIGAQGERLDARIGAQGERLDARIGALGERLDARIGALDARIGAQGERLEARIGALDARIGALGERFDTFEHRFDRLEADFRSFQERTAENHDVLNRRIDQVIFAVNRSGGSTDLGIDTLIPLLMGTDVRIPLPAVVPAAYRDARLERRQVSARFADNRLVLYPDLGDDRIVELLHAEGWRPVEADRPDQGFVAAPAP